MTVLDRRDSLFVRDVIFNLALIVIAVVNFFQLTSGIKIHLGASPPTERRMQKIQFVSNPLL